MQKKEQLSLLVVFLLFFLPVIAVSSKIMLESMINSQTVIIDYSTFIGEGNDEYVNGVLLDSANNPILVGTTYSSGFPVINGTPFVGGRDIFVVKFNGNNLSEVIFSTIIGGTGDDDGGLPMIAADDSIFLVGQTESTDFPTTPSAYDQIYNGGTRDGYVAKLASNGTLLFATYLGGSNRDTLLEVELDSQGNIWVAGKSLSNDYPTTPDAWNTSYNGGTETDSGYIDRSGGDGIYTKLSANGSTLLYSSYIGGSDNDQLWRIKIDNSDNVILSGMTKSVDFPTTPGAYDTTYSNQRDIFVTKFAPNGSSMIFSTFIGSSGEEEAWDSCLDASGNIIICGWTDSQLFPTTDSAFDTTLGGDTDCVIFKLSSNGSTLLFSTFLGGSIPFSDWTYGHWETFTQVTIDETSSNIYLTGWLTTTNFPVTDRSEYNGGDFDCFVSVFSSDASTLLVSSLIGGRNREGGSAICSLSSQEFYCGFHTKSSAFPVTADAYDSSYNGGGPETAPGGDAVLMKLTISEFEFITTTILPSSTSSSSSESSSPSESDTTTSPTTEGISGFEFLCVLTLTIAISVVYSQKRK